MSSRMPTYVLTYVSLAILVILANLVIPRINNLNVLSTPSHSDSRRLQLSIFLLVRLSAAAPLASANLSSFFCNLRRLTLSKSRFSWIAMTHPLDSVYRAAKPPGYSTQS